MSECNQGSLSTIRSSSIPDDCGCDCTPADIIYTGEAFECNAVVPNERLDSVLNKILTKLCDIDAEVTVTDIVFDCLNGLPSPTSGGLTETLQFFADNTLFRGGNTCDCPVTDDILFAQGKGVAGCDNGSVLFETDYVTIDSDTQVRVTSDLKVTNGFGAGYGGLSSSTDLGLINLSQLNYTYGLDCTGGSRTITLPQIAEASLNHKNRRFGIRRVDCTVANTGTIQAYSGETIEGAGSITLPIGHAFILQADDVTNNWVIVAEYFGCDTIEAQNNGDIYMAYSLGVGDSSPDAKLDVSQSDTTKIAAIFENTGAASADLVRVNRNGSTIDVIDEAGRLQVGGSNPAAMLHVTGEGSTSATNALVVEDSSGVDHIIVSNDGGTKIRPAVDKVFNFTPSGDISVVNDSGIIRNWTITGSVLTLSYVRLTTLNAGISPASSSTDTYFDIDLDCTASSGTNATKVLDLIVDYNLTGTATGDTYGIKYSPTYTSTGGNNYGIVVDNVAANNGFGISAPVSTLESGGSVGYKTLTVTTDTTLDETHHHVFVNAAGGAINITLPAANTCAGREYFIKKIDAVANNVTITAASSIDGAGSKTISQQYAFYRVISNGSTYYISGNN